jgi:protein-S-isoprenylcysteine O-methyltransferase Ste14
MDSLELKVLPDFVVAILAAAMWGVSLFTPHIQLQPVARMLAAATIALVGAAFTIAGIVSFRRAKTTVSPLKPESASSLVSSGVYTITRNPMYVGLLSLLVAWAVFLSSPLALVGPLAFFLYIGRFQIAPEERALSNLFGSEYANYRARVRRWL